MGPKCKHQIHLHFIYTAYVEPKRNFVSAIGIYVPRGPFYYPLWVCLLGGSPKCVEKDLLQLEMVGSLSSLPLVTLNKLCYTPAF